MSARRVALALALAVACGGSRPPPPENRALGGGVVARVGDVAITADLVSAVAAARGLSPKDALDRLVDDALAAEGARAKGLDRGPAVEWSKTATTARLVAERLRDDAREGGPPTDAEVSELSKRHWREVDLGERVKVVHAVVLRPKTGDPSRAKAVAHEIAAAVAGATDVDDFEARAKAVPHEGLDVRVERLPEMVEDGRFADRDTGEGVVAPFAAAAFALKTPGATSGVVETEFGWHVIRLVERLPSKAVPWEERRAMFADEVVILRANRAHDAILSARRAKTAVEVAPAADALLRELPAP